MNPYALAWTLTAAVGAALSVILLVESILDLKALHGDEQNGRRFRVWGRMIQEGIRLTVHIPFAVIGLLALDSPVSEASLAILILLYGNAAFILNSIVAMVVRRKADSGAAIVAEAELITEEAVEDDDAR